MVWGSEPHCSHCHPLTLLPQVLTNENGGIAMLSSLGGPMDVKSFYISNPNKVMHLVVKSADDRTTAKMCRPHACVVVSRLTAVSNQSLALRLQDTPLTVTVTTVPPQSSPLVIELQANQGPTLTFPGLTGEYV